MISEELYRNIFLATVCVFATTWLLLFNLTASVLVLGCVVLTLVNVGGFIHFWGLTIDTVSCINLIIAVGLCVDYSAHIVHNFLAIVPAHLGSLIHLLLGLQLGAWVTIVSLKDRI